MTLNERSARLDAILRQPTSTAHKAVAPAWGEYLAAAILAALLKLICC